MMDPSDFPPAANWPVLRQIKNRDPLGLRESAASSRSESLEPRIKHADRVVNSVCPYCAVGCAQLVYVKNEKIINIEGDPASPISNGCLCPKGAATFQLVTGSHRVSDVLYRRPHGVEWERIPLEQAMDMVADRVKKTRDATFVEKSDDGKTQMSSLAIFSLGGATIDNEWNHLQQKLLRGLGIVAIENQARI